MESDFSGRILLLPLSERSILLRFSIVGADGTKSGSVSSTALSLGCNKKNIHKNKNGWLSK
jgi:hypothetical protein